MDVTADLRFAIKEETQNGRRFVAAVPHSNTMLHTQRSFLVMPDE